jgi:hypothetical protein
MYPPAAAAGTVVDRNADRDTDRNQDRPDGGGGGGGDGAGDVFVVEVVGGSELSAAPPPPAAARLVTDATAGTDGTDGAGAGVGGGGAQQCTPQLQLQAQLTYRKFGLGHTILVSVPCETAGRRLELAAARVTVLIGERGGGRSAA